MSGVLALSTGSVDAENHPKITVQQCNASKTCTTQQREIVLDSNWRWLRNNKQGQYNNCYTGNTRDPILCSSPTTCTQNCALEGANYSGTYGITASGNSVRLQFVTKGQYGTNVGTRVYLMDTASTYQMFSLLNQEFTFDVDMSNLPCGLNGALYFVQMDKDGGMSRFPSNKYGTIYCDAQCARDIKLINGECANLLDWANSPTDPEAGKGHYGTCFNEMDIWEASKMASAYTPHTCGQGGGQVRCEGSECASFDDRYSGICDKDGKTVNTNSKITVVTQIIASGGALTEIKRSYDFFGDINDFVDNGGMRAMGQALQKGMVLAMSIWDDHEAEMLWLDGSYPLDMDPSEPGITRGECAQDSEWRFVFADSGRPTYVHSTFPNASVTFSNIKYGPLNSTF
ncbi:family 7 glycoside hydrolase [Pterulicium gracile]|uniref:Glucanase n=1 Tax=Pterulicium gracile TaxID=1884261 RepID=A0A5C3Q9V0_9AGAR|nr:family 7 glycoside hydrolase [Pterula gracilis]